MEHNTTDATHSHSSNGQPSAVAGVGVTPAAGSVSATSAAAASPSAPAPSASSAFGAGLLQPSSFSSALSAHPFMASSHAPMPHSSAAFASPTRAEAASVGSVSAPQAAFASPRSSASLHVPLMSSPTRSSPHCKKRSSAQYVEEDAAYVRDEEAKPLVQQAKHTRGEDSDDDLEAGLPRTSGSPLASQDEMDDADELATKGRAAGSNKAQVAQTAADDEDSSFMSLLSKLANLEFPDRNPSVLERCPICPNSFPLDKFAAHVYECIQSLDGDEKKEQERLDAKMAEQLAQASGEYGGLHSLRRRGMQLYGRVSPEAVEEQESQLLEKFERNKGDICEAGQECQRVDAQHFVLKWHPEVECPLCSELLPVYEVNAHVTICLDRPASMRPPKRQESDVNMDGAGKKAPAAAASSSAASASSFNAGAFSSAAIALPSHSGNSLMRHRARKLSHRSASASMSGSGSQDDLGLLGSPPDDEDDDAAADDEAEDDDEKVPAPLALSSSPSIAASAPLQRSSSERQLSLAQASAVASLVIARKTAAPSKAGEKDPSLLELLNTFSSLGFTRQNLEALHAEHQSKQDEKK